MKTGSDNTTRRWMSGLWALSYTYVSVGSHHFRTNYILASSPTLYLRRSDAASSAIHRQRGIQSATLPVRIKLFHRLWSNLLTLSAVELIDAMLVVDPEHRFNIDDCSSSKTGW